jgi:hypothetical protein
VSPFQLSAKMLTWDCFQSVFRAVLAILVIGPVPFWVQIPPNPPSYARKGTKLFSLFFTVNFFVCCFSGSGGSFLNADRVKRKLPSLLVDGSTTKKNNWNSLMRYRYRFIQFKKVQPEEFSSITNRILVDLTDLEKAVNESKNTDQRRKA